MKEYCSPKHKHMLPWYCWCVNSDNGHQKLYHIDHDKAFRKMYRKRARRKSKKIIKEQQSE